MTDDALQTEVRGYYEQKLLEHGPTARCVDWNSEASQELRFKQLARLLEDDHEASVLDYGCGYGALAGYLRRHGHCGAYTGFDISPAMVRAAVAEDTATSAWRMTSVRAELAPVDYTIASGLFNVKLQATDEAWRQYAQRTLADIAGLSVRGFAFNALSSYADRDRRRADLYYADALELFDYCRRTYAPAVSLLHDYPLCEFTVIVRR